MGKVTRKAKKVMKMFNCDVPNICVFILCVGWYLLGIKVANENRDAEKRG